MAGHEDEGYEQGMATEWCMIASWTLSGTGGSAGSASQRG